MQNSAVTQPASLSSVDNALRLLRYLGEHRVLRVNEASAKLGVSQSTAHRLLTSLRAQGFVVQDKPNGPYRPGPSLTEIGVAALGGVDIRRVARPVLQATRDRIQETVSLLVLEGRNVRFIDCAESPRSVRVGSRTGMVLPAHCTAGGKAILAALPAAEFERRYGGNDLEVRTMSSIQDQQVLLEDLEAIHERGYALNFEEGEGGISAIALAIPDLVGAPLGAIAVAVPTTRLSTLADAEELLPELVRARTTVTELLHKV